MKAFGISFAILMTLAGVAHAAGLAPRKASDVVMLVASNNDCPFDGEAVDHSAAADGTTGPFTIPEGQALVIQSVQWRVFTTAAQGDQHIEIQLSLQTPTSSTLVAGGAGSISDSGGGNAGSLQLTPGLVVRPGQTLCTYCKSSSTSATVQCLSTAQGFLTKNK